ncbi:hypothetical protein AOLI_G00313430 [Acnodon oligacanthus]
MLDCSKCIPSLASRANTHHSADTSSVAAVEFLPCYSFISKVAPSARGLEKKRGKLNQRPQQVHKELLWGRRIKAAQQGAHSSSGSLSGSSLIRPVKGSQLALRWPC